MPKNFYEEFLSDTNTYNLKIGGSGGFTVEEAKNGRQKTDSILQEKYGDGFRKVISARGIKQSIVTKQEKRATDPNYWKWDLENQLKGNSATLTQQARQKRIETMKKNGHSQGSKNNQFGKMWIYNIETFEHTRILKTGSIPEGWIKGRKIL